MPIRLDRRAPDFGERFRAFLATKREASADVDAVVRAIIADVAARGDRALIELSRKLDRVDLDQTGLRVGADEIDAAYAACDRRALDALALARDRIEACHRRQLPADERFIDPLALVGHRVMNGERLDHIAWQHFRDAERFWRICDANRGLWPDDLLAEAAILRIPASEG